MQGSVERRIGPIINWYAGTHGPSNWSVLLNWDTGSMDRQISPFSIGMQGSTDRQIGLNFKRWKQGSTDPQTAEQVQILKGKAGVHGPLIKITV